ncbi:hypothetical protein EF908_05605 [Streptomyces sp. WAC04770]|nr:hypothetical protein EF908_05605 [Streptomyces sp. WAC04770]
MTIGRHAGNRTADPPAPRTPSADLDRPAATRLGGCLEGSRALPSPPITHGYYAHFMPEPGSKGRATADGPLVERKAEEMGGLGKCWKKS